MSESATFSRRLREPEGPVVTVNAVGDIGLSGRAARTAAMRGGDCLFRDVRSVLAAADITFGNLEYPLAEGVAATTMFAAPPDAASSLRAAGFSLLHLANNHVSEHGIAGLASTLRALDAAGITALGAGSNAHAARRVVRTDRHGVRIGWLGCGRTLEPQAADGPRYWEFDEEELVTAAKTARGDLDVLIVSIHIGLMYMDYPRPEHQTLARRLVDAGAALVLMHHAHVLQGIEVRGDHAVICYNLGNFLLDWREGHVEVPMVVDRQQEGGIFRFDLDRRGVVSMTVVPTLITDECCVGPPPADRAARIAGRLETISEAVLGDYAAAFEKQRAERNAGPILKVLAVNAARGNFGYVLRQLRKIRGEHFSMIARWLMSRAGVKS